MSQIQGLTGVADGAAAAEAVVVLRTEIFILARGANGVCCGCAAAPHPLPYKTPQKGGIGWDHEGKNLNFHTLESNNAQNVAVSALYLAESSLEVWPG